jgi:hypothetical protein
MPFEFRNEKLIVCEGKTDKRFFDSFLRSRGIAGFDVYYPIIDDKKEDSGGIDKVGRHLRNISLQEDFIQNVRSVVVIGDNDDDDAFDRICRQVVVADYTKPTRVAEMKPTRGKADLGILLLPEEPPGCLETLCRQAADTKWPELSTPLRTFIDATPSTGWSATKQSKTAVECILAVTCEKQPEVDLGNIWQKDQKYHIPLNVPIFDYIETFLRSF